MFKKFRIKHEGLHRLGVIFAVIFVPFMFWMGEYFKDNIFELYFWVLSRAFRSVADFSLSTALHIVYYFIGYFLFASIIWLTKWIKEGFKK